MDEKFDKLKKKLGKEDARRKELAARRLVAQAIAADQEGNQEKAKDTYMEAGVLLQDALPSMTVGTDLHSKLLSLFNLIINRCEELETIIQSKAKRKAQIKRIADEILATERSYVTCLTTLSELYIEPLIQASKLPSSRSLASSSSSSSSSALLRSSSSSSSACLQAPIVNLETARTIFCNIDDILKIHMNLLGSLETLMGNWEQSDAVVADIAKLLRDITPEFSCYHQYVNGYNASHETIKRQLEENEKFAKFLEEAHRNPKCNLLDLADFELLHFSDHTSNEHAMVAEALAKIKELSTFINEKKRQADSMSRMVKLQAKISKKGSRYLDLNSPHRVLVREGYLTRITETGREKQLYVFVFSDLIMFSSKLTNKKNVITETLKYDYKHHIMLDGCVVEDVTEDKDGELIVRRMKGTDPQACFKLIDFAIPEKPKTFIWKTQNMLDKKGWMKDLQTAVQQAKK